VLKYVCVILIDFQAHRDAFIQKDSSLSASQGTPFLQAFGERHAKAFSILWTTSILHYIIKTRRFESHIYCRPQVQNSGDPSELLLCPCQWPRDSYIIIKPRNVIYSLAALCWISDFKDHKNRAVKRENLIFGMISITKHLWRWGLFERVSSSWNNVKCQLGATR